MTYTKYTDLTSTTLIWKRLNGINITIKHQVIRFLAMYSGTLICRAISFAETCKIFFLLKTAHVSSCLTSPDIRSQRRPCHHTQDRWGLLTQTRPTNLGRIETLFQPKVFCALSCILGECQCFEEMSLASPVLELNKPKGGTTHTGGTLCLNQWDHHRQLTVAPGHNNFWPYLLCVSVLYVRSDVQSKSWKSAKMLGESQGTGLSVRRNQTAVPWELCRASSGRCCWPSGTATHANTLVVSQPQHLTIIWKEKHSSYSAGL
jgi:hypothetical protein